MKKILTSCILLIPFLLASQKLDMDLFEKIEPRSIGPGGMAGRITSIDVVHSQSEIIYVGTASGGLWKSTSGGVTWEAIFDKQTTSSIGAVAIQQSNPSVVWVGTGEGNPRNSLNGGDGIYKSLDGGKHWIKMGLEKSRNIHRIIIHPQNPDIVYVAVIGSPWGLHPERGVYKTMDGGMNWERILFTNQSSGAADLVMDPRNPNKLIAALWDHHRDPWFFRSGGNGSGLFISHDAGKTWEQRSDEDGLPEGDLGRIGLAIAPSSPEIIYALIESKKNALYKSTDGGFKWKLINDKDEIGNRPFYYSDLRVDPKNENRIYSIFTYINVSEDGGRSFSELMPAYGVSNGVHPDHHAWWIHPDDPNYMMDGNDGGLNITRDRGETWHFAQNIPVAQFYHIAVDHDLPYNVYGGMQDNGSWAGPAYTWRVQGIRNSYWQEISFGDGFDVLPDPDNSRFGISASQQGSAVIYDRLTGYNEGIRPTHPEREEKLRFNWNAAMNRDPFHSNTLYFGSQFVHKSTDGGQTWNIISEDLTTNNPDYQKQGESGGLTMDATGAENYCTILVIEPSPIQKELLWIGTDDGQVHLSLNGGDDWQNITTNIPMPTGAWINQIRASNHNPAEALLVANDYRRFNDAPMVYRTRDFGKSWEQIVDKNDVIGYALCVLQDPIEPNLYFLGTGDGLYVSFDEAENWNKWTAGFPTTNVMDLVIQPREHDLVIGTFGRAAYVLDDIQPLRAIAAHPAYLDDPVKLFQAPDAYQVSIQQPTGSRFGADGMFHGENRSFDARITYSLQVPESLTVPDQSTTNKKKKSKKEQVTEPSVKKKVNADSITFQIMNGSSVIRTLKLKTPEKSGFHKLSWRLDEKGIPYISRKNSRTSNAEPGGIDVLPGDYKIKVHYGEHTDSSMIKVLFDPRIDISQQELIEKYDALKALEKSEMKMYVAVNRLKEGLKLADKFKADFEDLDSVLYISEIELCQNIQDSINVLLDHFFGEEDERQGITMRSDKTLMSLYRQAFRYTANAGHTPTSTEYALISKFESHLVQVLENVNGFYEKDWLNFRTTIEQLSFNPFMDYEKIK